MKKFYFTFGNSYDYPYQGGYLVVNAIDRDDAIEKYRRKYPDIHENTVNCAFIYTENEWKNINLGQSLCHEVIDCRFKFIEAKLVDMAHFKMYEGKFQDMEQMKNGVEVYIYANVSTFEAYTFEESEIKVYAHPFEKLYYADDYQLELNRIDTNELKDVLITNYKEAISKA